MLQQATDYQSIIDVWLKALRYDFSAELTKKSNILVIKPLWNA